MGGLSGRIAGQREKAIRKMKNHCNIEIYDNRSTLNFYYSLDRISTDRITSTGYRAGYPVTDKHRISGYQISGEFTIRHIPNP